MMHGVLISPSAFREAANALGNALGYGPDTYSVPLYPAAIAATEPTHYGACAPVTDDFILLVQGAEQGIIPDALVELGYSGAGVQSLINELTIDFSNIAEEPVSHFERVLSLSGLSRSPYIAA